MVRVGQVQRCQLFDALDSVGDRVDVDAQDPGRLLEAFALVQVNGQGHSGPRLRGWSGSGGVTLYVPVAGPLQAARAWRGSEGPARVEDAGRVERRFDRLVHG